MKLLRDIGRYTSFDSIRSYIKKLRRNSKVNFLLFLIEVKKLPAFDHLGESKWLLGPDFTQWCNEIENAKTSIVHNI